jgi:hypothetical protein
MGHVTVKAPYGIAWSMPAHQWDRLAAALGPKAHRYQVSPSSPSDGHTGTAERASA